MEKAKIQEAIKALRTEENKRKFAQTVDLVVNLQGLDMKKPEHQLDFYITLPHNRGRKIKVCALIGPELTAEAASCDKAVMENEFETYGKDKKTVKKLADEYDYFIAQANIMPKIATAFGKIFGPKRKMPNPKAGCVVPPKTVLKPLVEKLQTLTRIYAKEKPIVQCVVGIESMKDEDLIENAAAILDQIIHHLPGEANNIKNAYLKLTMSKPIKVL